MISLIGIGNVSGDRFGSVAQQGSKSAETLFGNEDPFGGIVTIGTGLLYQPNNNVQIELNPVGVVAEKSLPPLGRISSATRRENPSGASE